MRGLWIVSLSLAMTDRFFRMRFDMDSSAAAAHVAVAIAVGAPFPCVRLLHPYHGKLTRRGAGVGC
jgi:hypothetical protein